MTIDEAFVRDLFEKVWPKLDKAVARYGGTHSKEDVWRLLAEHRAQLWVHPRENPVSAIITTVEHFPTGLKEIHGWLAGGDLDGIRELERQIEAAARAHGFDRMLFVGREGFIRAMPGYRKLVVSGVKELNNESA